MAEQEFTPLLMRGSMDPTTLENRIRFIEEPGDRVLIHPDVALAMSQSPYTELSNDGKLTIKATNGTAVYQHTSAWDGCLVFERVSWEPK